jgi:hypothetical protein
VPYFEPEELEGVSEIDRRFIARSYARENRREQSQRISGVARSAAESGAPALRRTA